MRDVYPTVYYKDEGFVELKLEINEEDLREIIEEYLMRSHSSFVPFMPCHSCQTPKCVTIPPPLAATNC